MSFNVLASTLGTMAPAEGFPPTPEIFWQPLFSVAGVSITRAMVVAAISVVGIAWWLVATTQRAAVVPSKGQFFTEGVYGFVRNGIAKDMIGSKDFLRFVPLLFSLFIFILVNNLFGIVPFIQMPTMSRIGFPIALVLVVYVVYHGIGIKKHGLAGYFKFLVPGGLPGWIVPFIFVLEFITFFITRPLTLALRLFGNMFAGHMLLVVFIVGGWELFLADSFFLKLAALPAWVLAFAFTLFEGLVQFLQAYVFTLLAASYIGGALADEH
ncbi:F0F1 ATP synthase subunit A [Intrasporangium calvum]|uniref:ATP synthase subunit a n=1 Tax=Intrasporangium calvum TaxID=53358 RepID=A0ABT5GHG6_9MICO|nr:F0F1 ATP synthase subunit A [Intrasporangium calvum]MDC5697361.1 F0F1 ATP synthase subunit A [Intrasporangium calvum]